MEGHEIALISVLPLDQHRHAARPLELTPEIILEIAQLMPLYECDVLSSPWWDATRNGRAGHDDVAAAGRLRACVEDSNANSTASTGGSAPGTAT